MGDDSVVSQLFDSELVNFAERALESSNPQIVADSLHFLSNCAATSENIVAQIRIEIPLIFGKIKTLTEKVQDPQIVDLVCFLIQNFITNGRKLLSEDDFLLLSQSIFNLLFLHYNSN